MRYKQNWEKARQKYLDFWAMENHDRPVLLLNGKKDVKQSVRVTPPADLLERWTNTEYVIQSSREQMENTVYLAESIPAICPNLGPDIFGASLGADLVFEQTTSFSKPFVRNWETDTVAFRLDNPWWQKILSMTKEVAADAQGDYMVGITDLHPGADGLVSIRGPENLCMDLYDEPEAFEVARKILLPAFRYQLDTLYDVCCKNLPGSTNWMGLWHPEKWYVTSCDFICMISQEMFARYILPELREEIDYLQGKTIFHLDGPGALKHLDALLEIENLAGIQWVYGAGQPSARHWLPVLQRIQKAGKRINIGLHPEDIDPVFEALEPEGLSCYFDFSMTAEEAEAVLRRCEGIYRNKRRIW